MRRVLIAATAAMLVSVVGWPAPPDRATAAAPDRAPERLENRYIVSFRPAVDHPNQLTEQLATEEGFRSIFRFRHALEGFTAVLPPGIVRRLRSDPRVDFVVRDRVVQAEEAVPLAAGDTAPTGVRRIDAATTTSVHQPSTENVAVIDTGIDLDHPDLDAVDGINCMGSGPAEDQHGHGTHVAGTIGAKNNGSGVVGVAPGTDVFAVKVLGANGSGTDSSVICGIDWVTGTLTDGDPSNDITVANMSLGGSGTPIDTCGATTDPMHLALCRSTSAGVTHVVAAGNDDWDFDFAPQPDTPAAYPQALTVTAASDSDGEPGGSGGSPTCRTGEYDDGTASFSNFATRAQGIAHTVAGPGVCILSTRMGGGTTTMSGTSMATPHVAGLVALCLGEGGQPGPCAGMTPAQIIQKVRADAEASTTSEPGYGFQGDPLRPVAGEYYGYLSHVGLSEPELTEAAPAATVVQTGSVRSGGPANLATDDDSYFEVNSSTSSTRTSSWYGSFTVPNDIASLRVTYQGRNSPACKQTVSVWNWSSGSWAQFDSRTVGTTEVLVAFTPSGTLGKYVSGSSGPGEVRARVKCTSSSSTFVASADLLKIGYPGGGPPPSPSTTIEAVPTGTTVQTGSLVSGGPSSLAADDDSFYEVSSNSNSTRTSSWYGSFTGVPNTLASLSVAYQGKNSSGCTQNLYVRNWSSDKWAQFDSRAVGSTEVVVQGSPGGTAGDYVSGSSGDGEVRVRVKCTSSSSTFVNSGDLLRIAYAA